MLHLLSAPLVAVLLHAAPPQPVGLVEASAPVTPAIPTFSISALMDKPEMRLGERHRVIGQLHGQIDEWNPYLTRFHADDYRCVTFWADEQWLWIKEEFDAPAVEFFVRRDGPVDELVTSTKRHGRMQLDLIVREVHAGRAWIEVVRAERTEQQTPEGTVLHAIRALDLVEREGWALAINELDRAMRPNLPGHVRRELETLKSLCETAKEQ